MSSLYLLQLGNCLILSWIGTEYLICSRLPRIGSRNSVFLLVWVLLNFGSLNDSDKSNFTSSNYAASLVYQGLRTLHLPLPVVWHGIDSALHSLLGPVGLVSFTTALVVTFLGLSRLLHKNNRLSFLLEGPYIFCLFFATWFGIWILSSLSGLASCLGTEASQLAVKFTATGLSYYALCYWDVKQYKPGFSHRDFVANFAVATTKALALLPIVTVLVASFFLVLVTFLEFFRMPTAWLNWPIFYCALYGPFLSIYFLVKRQVKNASLLPL
uniref:Uncharacterized protein n=1 Tax=Tetraselmis sp. GSL018 TaxID=582737 RepID=A0A061R1K5_9CHLO|mmetsp:Transcript_9640/g.23164  ORF Transcript_9640/g.23164 Transcript_9640/m.23164 type:complete len:270 (+) Transcript_9640:370-1179(+)